MQRRSGIGMLASQRLLRNLERSLVERFHLGIATTIVEVQPDPMKQIACICEGEVMLVNESGTMEKTREIRFIRRELPIVHLRRRFPERMDGPFCPLTLLFHGHGILQHGLDETMDAQPVSVGLTTDQGVLA